MSDAGEICVNTLKKDWKSSYGIAHILVTVKCLLIYPNPDSALDEEAGKLLQENYESYCERAKLITSVHATPKVRLTIGSAPLLTVLINSRCPFQVPPPEFTKSASVTDLSSQPTPLDPPKPSTSSVISSMKVTSSPPFQPLQQSASNKISVSSSLSSLSGDEKGKERVLSPTPLGTADSNVSSAGTAKAVKRGAAPGVVGSEKRKKALKRL